ARVPSAQRCPCQALDQTANLTAEGSDYNAQRRTAWNTLPDRPAPTHISTRPRTSRLELLITRFGVRAPGGLPHPTWPEPRSRSWASRSAAESCVREADGLPCFALRPVEVARDVPGDVDDHRGSLLRRVGRPRRNTGRSRNSRVRERGPCVGHTS